MRYIKLALLVTLALTLTGCDDDFFDGGGASGGGGGTAGDYDAYWNTIETISVDGHIPDVSEMTQKQEPPAPQGDPEDYPTVMVLLMLLGGLWAWQRNRKICPVPVNAAT